VWSLQEPLDQRLLGCDYSNVAVLGKGLTRGPRWRPIGIAAHTVNGALFGLVFHEARARLPIGPRRVALSMALAEHVAFALEGPRDTRRLSMNFSDTSR
jgi:hypothetical protein